MQSKLLLTSIFLCMAACASKKPLPVKPDIRFLAQPLMLKKGWNTLYITDYTTNVKDIKFTKNPNVNILWDGLSDTALIELTNQNCGITSLNYSVLANAGEIPLRPFLGSTTSFQLPDNDYQTVSVKGTFNAWNPDMGKMVKQNNLWSTTLDLGPGNHQYVFVVNGKTELVDPANPMRVSNNMGGENSQIENKFVRNSHLESSFKNEKQTTLLVNSTQNVCNWLVVINNQTLNFSQTAKSVEIELANLPKENKLSYIRVFAGYENGLVNDAMFPIINGKIIQNASELPRNCMQSSVMYNPMIDRFFNGNPVNDKPLNREDVLPKVDWMGGDVAGLTQKLNEGYFDSLGINTLWISPIIKNPEEPFGEWPNPKTKFSGYHGYWPVSSTLTEPRLCTEAELQTFIQTAHKHNINVLFDYVAHHIHTSHPTFKTNPNWYTPLYLPNGTKNTEKWDEHRLTTWFDDFLPTFNFANPQVLEQQTDSAIYWLKKYPIDGFRHDATKHIPEAFWRMLNTKIRNQVCGPLNRNIYQIGETYGSPQLIASYLSSGMLDAQFDFNLYDAAMDAFKLQNTNFKQLVQSLSDAQMWYGNNHTMGNITGNQDRPRFISIADGSVNTSLSTKQQGWDKDIQVTDAQFFDNLLGLTAFMCAVPGIPVIYYGDEIGLPGANDPDSRRMMQFSQLSPDQAQLKTKMSKLIKLRRSNMALQFGNTKIRYVTDHALVIERTYLGKKTIIVFNRSNKQIEIDMKEFAPKNNLYCDCHWLKNKIILPANQFDFFYD